MPEFLENPRKTVRGFFRINRSKKDFNIVALGINKTLAK